METRAHFVIVGLFTILGIVGGLGFFMWLASVQIDRQYARYGILFEDVTGLDQSADVFFNGVNVGRVISIRIWENDPRLVYVGIEIEGETPISVGTVAQIASQGVTGVAYIALSGGAPSAELLTPSTDGFALIRSRPSSLQSLLNSAPKILDDVAEAAAQMRALTGPENQNHVRSILQNVDAATAEFETALAYFSEITIMISDATSQISRFTDRLTDISDTAEQTLQNADDTLTTITGTFEKADSALDALMPTIDETGAAFASMDRYITEDLVPLSNQLAATLQAADDALISMDSAFANADQIMTTDIGPVLADARTALAELTAATASITNAIPGIMDDLRATVAEVRSAVSAASPGMRDFGRLGGEARAMVRAINTLVQQIARDPAGFVLQNRVPDYRR